MPSVFEIPVSSASAAVITGALVSLAVVVIVCVSSLLLPATSLATTMNACEPAASATLLNVKSPLVSACVVRDRGVRVPLAVQGDKCACGRRAGQVHDLQVRLGRLPGWALGRGIEARRSASRGAW